MKHGLSAVFTKLLNTVYGENNIGILNLQSP